MQQHSGEGLSGTMESNHAPPMLCTMWPQRPKQRPAQRLLSDTQPTAGHRPESFTFPWNDGHSKVTDSVHTMIHFISNYVKPCTI